MASPFQFRHLVRRSWAVARARALTPDEQIWVSGHLSPAEGRLFWGQVRADQRHAHDVARHVAERGSASAIRAALLHDVGKRHSRLGVVGRSIATLLFLLRLPMTPSMRRYIDHGPLGADDLASLGVEPLVEAFARFHHQPTAAPGGDEWGMLAEADHRA